METNQIAGFIGSLGATIIGIPAVLFALLFNTFANGIAILAGDYLALIGLIGVPIVAIVVLYFAQVGGLNAVFGGLVTVLLVLGAIFWSYVFSGAITLFGSVTDLFLVSAGMLIVALVCIIYTLVVYFGGKRIINAM